MKIIHPAFKLAANRTRFSIIILAFVNPVIIIFQAAVVNVMEAESLI
jgi:hypothetical protein